MPPDNDDPAQSSVSTDFVSVDDYTVDQLRASLFDDPPKAPSRDDETERPELDPLLAVSLLGQKTYDGQREDLHTLLRDESRDVRLRHNAALALARAAGTDAEQPLLKALERTQQVEVHRGVLKALQAVGGEATLEVLVDRGDAFPEGLTSVLDWTRTLLAFRLNTPASSPVGRLTMPERATVDGKHYEITAQPATDELRDAILEARAREFPGRPIDHHDAAVYTIETLDLQLGLGLNATFVEQAGQPLDAKLVAGVVYKRDDIETAAWSPRNYILVQPTSPDQQGDVGDHQPDDVGETGAVFVTTTNGRIHYAGPFIIDDGGFRFELRAVDRPGLRSIHVEGTLQETELVLTEAYTTDNAPDARTITPVRQPDVSAQQPGPETEP
jgi:hypothetical protein